MIAQLLSCQPIGLVVSLRRSSARELTSHVLVTRVAQTTQLVLLPRSCKCLHVNQKQWIARHPSQKTPRVPLENMSSALAQLIDALVTSAAPMEALAHRRQTPLQKAVAPKRLHANCWSGT